MPLIFTFILDSLVPILSFIVILGVLVFVHELGHFWVAKRGGVKVEEFGMGFPPRLIKWTGRDGTQYSINAIPFGGFVRMLGEDGPSGPDSFAEKSKRTRAAILLAGPGMNLLLAFLLFTASFMVGWPAPTGGARITMVAPNSPAEQVGIEAGDVVLSVEGTPVELPGDLVRLTNRHLGEAVTVELQRNGVNRQVQLVPRVDPPEGQGAMGVQIGAITEIRHSPIHEAVVEGLLMTGRFVVFTLQIPAMLISGVIEASDARPIGPVGIGQLVGDAVTASVDTGRLFPVLHLSAILSAALGITNLLPLPALDGGRLIFILLEAIRGRRIAPEKEGAVHLIGMALLLSLMLIITIQDVRSPIPRLDWTNLGL